MKGLIQLYFVLCFPFLVSSVSHDQSFALIQFKNSFSIDCSASSSCAEPKEKTNSWKEGTNCCLWDGVKCESETGNVIGLDLSCSCLMGSIFSNSTLFLLQHLQHLNLAYNDFYASQIAPEFGQFTNLTNLNLSSSSSFTGEIPLEISHLSKLVSLDLSGNLGSLIFEDHVFEKVLGNLTQLQHLILDSVQLSSVEPTTFLNMSSYMKTLILGNNWLQGKFPEDVFRFPFLQKFKSSFNYGLEFNFPNSNWTAPLRSLEVSRSSVGELPDSIGNLKSLQVLDLSDSNNLEGSIPASLGNLTRLNYLDLSLNEIHGPILFSFSNFKQLSHLGLSGCHLNGSIPSSLGNLAQLVYLSLGNNQFSGPLPISAFNFTQIEILDFSDNKFEGSLPVHVSGLSRLHILYLDSNFLSGKIPSWLFSLPSLVDLRLSDNKLTGPIEQFDKVAPLETVRLSNNEIYGPIPSFSQFVNLTDLDLSSNKLNGIFDLSKLTKLTFLYLSNTSLVLSVTSRSYRNYSFPNLGYLKLSHCNLTEFPDVVRNYLQGLVELDLSYNRIQMIEADMFSKLQDLRSLDLSFNSLLSVSNKKISNVSLVLPSFDKLNMSACNISEVPIFLIAQESLTDLDLSNNFIHGQISTGTEWGKNLQTVILEKNYLTVVEYSQWTMVKVLNLRSNLLERPLVVPPPSTLFFAISDNKLTGEVPSSICNLVYVQVLDLSKNNMSGTIPECLVSGNISQQLSVLDLQRNHFHGNIPDSFAEGSMLRTLNLNRNNFDGRLPKSLINCHELHVLNLGNNKINDTFPHWLATLPQLKVLVLRANHFHGQIIQSENESHFSALRILDISRNEFSGFLPTTYFKSFNAMRNLSDVETLYMEGDSYYNYYMFTDSVNVTMKGGEFEFGRIPNIFTTIDMSSNNFHGKIPEIVGNITSLKVLNFSHNNLSGHIPSSFGNLAVLESLDLSSNKLDGEIPMQLAKLNFIQAFNLSDNRLVGIIPRGKQLVTFLNDSYSGNLGLCGFPLSKKCGNNEQPAPPPPVFHDEESGDSGFGLDWKFMLMGCGYGLVFGISAGYVMLTIQKPKWFVARVQLFWNKVMRR